MESDQFPVELQSETFKILSSNDTAAMETLFNNLQSQETLKFLQCCKHHHPELLMIKLFFLLTSNPNTPTRTNAARALLFLKPSLLWPKLRPQAQSRLQAHFITFLTQESSIHVLRLASVITAEILSVIYQSQSHQHWNEILVFLFSSLTSKNESLLEFSLLVFASISNSCRLILQKSLNDNLQLLHSSFLSSLSSTNVDVQVASFRAVVNLIRLFSDPSLFHQLLRAMMVVVFALLHGFEKSYFKSAFAELIKLVSAEPVLLKPYMNDMLLDALQIAENNSVSDETHRFVFELVLAMTELKECEQILVNLPFETIVRLFVVPMKALILSVKDDGNGDRKLEDGNGKDEDEIEKVGDDVYEFGMKCLKKLCGAFEGNKVVSVAHELLMNYYLDSKEWKKRHAGITLLTVIAKEFSDEMVLMESFQGEMVTKILKLFKDSNVQVRLAAFTLMEMPINFVQAAQILYHHRFVHAFYIALRTEEDNKVKEQASSAMLYFLKNTLPNSIASYKDADLIMDVLISILQPTKYIFYGDTPKDRRSAKLRSIALSIFNIVAQHCHEVAQRYLANYIPIIVEACSDKSLEFKEEAARGIRIVAEYGTLGFHPSFINLIFQELSHLMKDKNRSISENAKACDIAVSAIGRICEFHRNRVDGSRMIPLWLSFLPLKVDFVEAKIMHEQFCSMVARLDRDLLGPGNQNIVKIIAVFLEIIDKGDKLATAQTINRVNNLLKQLVQNIPRHAFDTILMSLKAQQRELLLSFVS